MRSINYDGTNISDLIFNLGNICIVYTEVEQEHNTDGIDANLDEIKKAMVEVSEKISSYIDNYKEQGFNMGVTYIKLAKLIKCLKKDTLINGSLNVLKHINKDFELNADNIDLYANTNDLLAEIGSKNIGNVATLSISNNVETVEQLYNTLLWFKENSLTEQFDNLYNDGVLNQKLSLHQYGDYLGLRITCKHCNKEKRLSKFNVGQSLCKKCYNDKLLNSTVKNGLPNINVKTANYTKELQKPNISDTDFNNTKPRYIKDKKKSKVEDAKVLYEEKKSKALEVLKEQENKNMSQFLDDLYSDKIYISIDNSLSKRALKNELFKYVERLKTEQSVMVNTPKIIFVAKHCLDSGELLTNLIHDLHLRNNHVSEYLNIRNINLINNNLSLLDDYTREALRLIVINNNWNLRSLLDNLVWLINKDILNNIDKDEFMLKAKAERTLAECISSSTVKITCSVCNQELEISKIRVGHNSCKECNRLKKTKSQQTYTVDAPKNNVEDIVKEENKTEPKKEASNRKTKKHASNPSDIIGNNIRDLNKRSKEVELHGGNIDMFDEYMSRLSSLSQYANELNLLGTDGLNKSQLEEIMGNLGIIINTLIDKLEDLEK